VNLEVHRDFAPSRRELAVAGVGARPGVSRQGSASPLRALDPSRRAEPLPGMGPNGPECLALGFQTQKSPAYICTRGFRQWLALVAARRSGLGQRTAGRVGHGASLPNYAARMIQ